MYVRNYSRLVCNTAAQICAAVILGGCLSGEEETAADGDPMTSNEVSGSVGDGPIIGADMRIVSNSGELLAEFISDDTANYSVTIQTNNESYPLLVDAQGGIDIVTNLPPDFVLLGAVFQPGTETVANANPFSTLAVETARDLPGGINGNSLAIAEGNVVEALGSSLASLAASGPMRTRIDASNIAEIVKSSEELAEIVRRVRDVQTAFGRPSTGDSVLQALGSDLTDGVVDGRGGSRVDARVSALTTVVAVLVHLESMQSELHVNGSDATDLMAAAITRVGGADVETTLADLVVTRATLESIDIGMQAILAVAATPQVSELYSAVDGIQSGMDAMLVRSLIPDSYRATLESALLTIAGSDDSTVDAINDIVRAGGGEPPQGNVSPTISGAPRTIIAANSTYTFTPTANDADGDTLSFSITNLPVWANFNSQTGELSGTPTDIHVGVYDNIVISVQDPSNASASLPAFSISVTAPAPSNTPPTISGTAPSQVTANTAYSFTPTANDADGDTLSFSITNLPVWANFNSQTGELSGTPTDIHVGVYDNIVISVQDPSNASANLPAFSISVTAPAPSNTPPTISGTAPSQVMANSAYSFTPTANDADGDTLSFSIANLPVWANFNSQTGELSGTPTDTHVGVYDNIVISVQDPSNASASLGAFSITVNAVSLGAVTLSWTPPTENEDGSALTDLAGYRIYWGTTPGVYPNSVTLNNPGLTSYMVENLAPGSYEFVATSFNNVGIESGFSDPVTQVVSP